jgi:polyisoprenyl-phosphate glycosyltransferase
MLVSAIIPAYNEEKTVSGVVRLLKDIPEIHEIIVVNDGSGDHTIKAASEAGATVVSLPENRGKGAAVREGAAASRGDILLMLDADLVGLKKEHVLRMLSPVIEGLADMAVGVFKKGRWSTDLAQKIAPGLSGQRALKKDILEQLPYLEFAGYGIEMALTVYAQRTGLRVTEVELDDVTHIMKEEKLGLIHGFAARMRMYWQIFRGYRLARR